MLVTNGLTMMVDVNGNRGFGTTRSRLCKVFTIGQK